MSEQDAIDTCIADLTSVLSDREKCQIYFNDMKCAPDDESCSASQTLVETFCGKEDESATQAHAAQLCARSSEVVGVSMYEMNLKLKESHGGYWDSLIYDASGSGSQNVGVGGIKSHVNQPKVRPDTDMLGREGNGVVFSARPAGSF